MKIQAVQCHKFSHIVVEEEKEGNSSRGSGGTTEKKQIKQQKKKQIFRPRTTPLPLKDCLSLDTIEFDIDDTRDASSYAIIRTLYAGIQYPDCLQAQGLYQIRPSLPYVPGMDVVGQVVRVYDPKQRQSNNNKSNHKDNKIVVGSYVYATLIRDGGTGGLAELVKVPIQHVYVIPPPTHKSSSQLSSSLKPPPTSLYPQSYLAGCANIGRNYFAAYHSLFTIGQIHQPPSQRQPLHQQSPQNHRPAVKIVLITGASGGVGMACIELVKAVCGCSCFVIAGVGDTTKMEAPKSVGADVVLCYGRTSQSRRTFKRNVLKVCESVVRRNGNTTTTSSVGVDLVVDMVQGDLFEQALVGVTRPFGTITLVGFAAGQRPIRPGLLLVKELRVVGSLWGRYAMEHPHVHYQNVQHILELLRTGQITPRVDRIIPLTEFQTAFELFETNRGRGNTVISFVENDSNNDSNDVGGNGDDGTIVEVIRHRRSRL